MEKPRLIDQRNLHPEVATIRFFSNPRQRWLSVQNHIVTLSGCTPYSTWRWVMMSRTLQGEPFRVDHSAAPAVALGRTICPRWEHSRSAETRADFV